MKTMNKPKLCLSLLLPSILAGCMALPDIPDLANLETSSSTKPSTTLQQATQKVELDAIKSSLEKHLAEWDQVRGDINRLIELEGELAYLANTLKQQSGLHTLTQPNDELLVLEDPDDIAIDEALNERFEPAKSVDITQRFTTTNVVAIDDKFSTTTPSFAAKPEPSESIRVQAARPVIGNSQANRSIGVDDNKFSTLRKASFESKANVMSVQNSHAVNQDDDCQTDYANDGRFAIHLSSVSNPAQVASASNNFKQKYRAVLCNKFSKAVSVNVNSKHFSSIRFGPYFDRASAAMACKTIKQSGDYCSVTTFDGDAI